MLKKYRNNELFHKFWELVANLSLGFCETNLEHSSPHDYDIEDQPEHNGFMPKEDKIPSCS